MARKVQLLIVADVLVAEEDNEVIEQCLLDRPDVVAAQRRPQVDAADLGTDAGGEGLNRERAHCAAGTSRP